MLRNYGSYIHFISNFYRFIEPTLLLNPPLDADVMGEEIFGPLLPIITVKINRHLFLIAEFLNRLFSMILAFVIQLDNIQESIDFINSRPKPLAIYAFTKDETFKRQIVAETSSGSVTFNDVLVQVLHYLPSMLTFHPHPIL